MWDEWIDEDYCNYSVVIDPSVLKNLTLLLWEKLFSNGYFDFHYVETTNDLALHKDYFRFTYADKVVD